MLLNAFFVIAEFSLVKIRKGQLEEMREKGRANAETVLKMLDERENYVSAVQLGITASSLMLGWYGGPLLSKGLLGLFEKHQVWYGTTLSVVCAFLIMVLLHVVLGELVPRTVALVKLENLALAVAGPIRFVNFIFYPLVAVTNKISRAVTWLLGIKQVPREDISRSENELRLIVSASMQGGELDKVESTLIDNVFDFNDRVAREVMVPRQDMVCLYTDDTLADNLDTVRSSGHTRYPLCEEDKDHVIGMIHVRDLMDVDKTDQDFDLRKIMRDIIVIPESMGSARILQTMQQNRLQIAVVADEYGGTAGLVSLEDLLEEIVGEIQDEHDEPELPEIVKLSEGRYSLDGLLLLDEAAETLGVDFDEPEEDTLGGYIFGQLGRKPEVGDTIRIGNWEFEVQKVDKFRIQRVLAERLPEEEPEAEEED